MMIGLVGLGKMGLGLAQNMMRNGIQVIGFDPSENAIQSAKAQRVATAKSLEDMLGQLPGRKIVWVMVPAGKITRDTVAKLGKLLSEGDIVIDGGNSRYKDSIENYKLLQERKIHFFDCGTSGGMSGALNGGNFMIGGDADVFPVIEPIFEKIAQRGGYLYTGAPGSGHYLKMVHNGIEYGMMAAIGEGFELLEKSPYDYDYHDVASLWNNGSVVRSWLMELTADAFKEDPKLVGIEGVMYSSGEGKWTIEEALDRQVSMPAITAALLSRYRSLESDTFAGKVVAAQRKGFGGHAVKAKGPGAS